MALVGRLALGLGVVTLLAAAPTRARGQISPGPLAQAHGALEGTLKCTQCHGTRKEAMSGQCLACHKEIAWLRDRQRGLHAVAAAGACAKCHPDHAGRDFALVAWNEDSLRRFDHRRAGWALEGGHAKVECAKCHAAEFRKSAGEALAPGSGTQRRWTGLERDCDGCHADIHKGGLGRDCLSCHGMEHWKPAPKFDHSRTAYALTGEHATVACAKCHLDPRLNIQQNARGEPVPVYKPVSHAECSDCHKDPHAGRLGAGCAACHLTKGFKVINQQSFNHAKTRYPLQGRHAQVACTKCHDFTGGKRRDPLFATCGSCHADAHAGLATIGGKPADCAACHSVDGFKPATFTVAQHRQSGYPLTGRHTQVTCGSCHAKAPTATAARFGTAAVIMRPAAARCRDCHGDDHGGQLATRADGGECSTCHVVDGWKPTRFDAAAHAKLRLPLEGRHAEIACAACHGPERKGLPPLPAAKALGRAGVLITLKETVCTACHFDPHQGQLKAQTAGGTDGACTACHGVKAFRPSIIDVAAHKRYGFGLEGAHRAVACGGCHADIQAVRPTVSLVGLRQNGKPWVLPSKGKTCEACHESPHGNQFASRPDKGACDACHGTDGFVPASRFDHDRDSGFPLTGGHAGVRCERCHKTEPAGHNTTRMIYGPLSGKCENCHGGATPKQPASRGRS